jgi:hypothetical protein
LLASLVFVPYARQHADIVKKHFGDMPLSAIAATTIADSSALAGV